MAIEGVTDCVVPSEEMKAAEEATKVEKLKWHLAPLRLAVGEKDPWDSI